MSTNDDLREAIATKEEAKAANEKAMLRLQKAQAAEAEAASLFRNNQHDQEDEAGADRGQDGQHSGTQMRDRFKKNLDMLTQTLEKKLTAAIVDEHTAIVDKHTAVVDSQKKELQDKEAELQHKEAELLTLKEKTKEEREKLETDLQNLETKLGVLEKELLSVAATASNAAAAKQHPQQPTGGSSNRPKR